MIGEDFCYVCGSPYTEEHHIFYGRNRQTSDRLGYTVRLCRKHHNEVHNAPNKGLDLLLKRIGQEEFEKKSSRAEFIRTFGKSYLEDET